MPRRRVSGKASLRPRAQAKHGMLGSDPAQLLLARVGSDTIEEGAHLGLPAPQVGAQDGGLLRLVGDLDGRERLELATQPQAPLAAHAQVACPLRVAARGDQVALAVE